MVSIIQNRTSIKGEILSVDVLSLPAGFAEIHLRVNESKKHKNYPDLVTVPESNELTLKLSSERAQELDLKKGTVITALARAAGAQGFFLIPDSIKVVKR